MDNAIDITKLREYLPMLLAKWQAKDDATLEYSAMVDAAANDTGVDKGVLKKALTAIKKEKAEDEKAAADALSELIETLAH
jgi:hypothetical protein